ncbi:SWIM zinc finger family protein [Paenibacillus rhizoplanae]|uniref:SWIM zinc finger family protein n=1 Tax=Paenibacillus rhizoplanae TaxID=1917181 RepID=UPI0036075E2E
MKKVMKINFTLEDIRDFCGDTFYERGQSYYNSGRVSELIFDAEINRYRAWVKGSKAYHVEIFNINFTGNDTEAYCTCPAYESYGCCKHVAATLIAIFKQKRSKSVSKNRRTTNTNITRWII